MTGTVRLERQGAVGILRLDRPPVNALNREMHGDLLAAAQEARDDPAVRSVLLWGGERAFAAGADIREMADLEPDVVVEFGAGLTRSIEAVAALPVPVVAGISGYALGGGCELALAADLRIAAADARIGLPEITLGVIPGAGGTQRLARLVGTARAKELIFTGRPVTGSEAAAIGLVTRAVPADSVYAEAFALAERLAAGPTAALAAAKEVVDRGVELDLASGLALEGRRFAELFGTADQKAGMASFLRDGPGRATFTGR
ncbi:enoyl-CoA hydratase/isomerase family protein [Nakamurella endophytica]|uniref:enoyl-CoA hydratase n=1 Tax=Nakamurella endophytica TaxID=1748367 RepID=A0A917SQ36_9ACTN|nr:enoyl-CoA hydratase-related protein [Nakamurella endophytica]GGL90763.1 enoyl-CoA hydratase [Nakamurella endophytica]